MTDQAAPLRDLLALNEGARRNGLASDGKGWYRTATDREDCYAVADAVLAIGETEAVWAGSRTEPRIVHVLTIRTSVPA